MFKKSVFFLCLVFTGSFSLLMANVSDYLKKFENTSKPSQIRNIDSIYLINLDQRPLKLERCLQQLAPWGITPYRFSAIYGWALPPDAFQNIGMKFLPGMHFGNGWAWSGVPSMRKVDLNESCYGITCFSGMMSKGAVGCTLSHLSILQNAYEAGYQTIWILEDDFRLHDNPHLLADLIDELDHLVGKEGWDILYTDVEGLYSTVISSFWRPDRPKETGLEFLKRKDIDDRFITIVGRSQTHSMIIRRSGIEKILRFEKEHGIFLSYDIELGFIPDLRKFCSKHQFTTPPKWNDKDYVTDTDKRHFN